jgi:hypothetical protein
MSYVTEFVTFIYHACNGYPVISADSDGITLTAELWYDVDNKYETERIIKTLETMIRYAWYSEYSVSLKQVTNTHNNSEDITITIKEP